MINLPKLPFSNIAISLSGGGYRATAFHLGTLSYLSKVNWDSKSLLDRVRIISTVSGGTFTGVNYATTIKKGGNIGDCYNSLYKFMTDTDLINDALAYLADDKKWESSKQRTLINAFAQIYHKKLEPEYFRLLWKKEPKIHLKELCFNATEFNFAIPFRFQKTEKSKDRNGNYDYGFIGNNFIRVPLKCAKEVRMADIIAASSCFPLGFEPINFPNDFIDENSIHLKNTNSFPTENYKGAPISYPIGLMDGGVDDNQGIDSVWWAEKRMRNYLEENNELASKDAKAIDLYVVSDVSSPYMESFIRSRSSSTSIIGNWSFKKLKRLGWLSFIISLFAFTLALLIDNNFITIGLSIIGTLGLLFSIVSWKLSRGFVGLTKKLGVPDYFTKRLEHFDTLKFNTYFNLIVNRGKSAMTMVSDVFMKQIRRSNYNKIYNDKEWKLRLIMNAVYELSPNEVIKREKAYKDRLSDKLLKPSKNLQNVAEKAKNMETTLWFTPHQLLGENNMLNTLIACGQFTICFNLLEYIEKVLKSNKNVEIYNKYDEELKNEIDQLYLDLSNDWQQFNNNPYWMVDNWNKKMK